MTQSIVEIRDTSPPLPRAVLGWARAIVIALLLFWLFWPALRVVAARWNGDANWSHGWLVPLFSLYFLHTRREQIAATPISTSYFGFLLFLLSVGAYFIFQAVIPYSYLQLMSLVGAIFGIVLFLTGWRMMRIAWLPILFLCLANPIPDQYYVELTIPLRMVSTQVSAMLLRLIPGIEIETQAVVMDYFYDGSKGQLNVLEACAGMRLMMAFVTLGVAMAYLGDRPVWQRICMVVTCVPISVFCNVIRVTVTGGFTVFGRGDLAHGTPHTLLGLAMLPIALGLFLLTGHILSHLFVDEEPAEAEEPA